MNIIAKLDEWYKEWRGHSHINDINQQIFDSADCQDFARLCVENALSERQETTEAFEPHGSNLGKKIIDAIAQTHPYTTTEVEIIYRRCKSFDNTIKILEETQAQAVGLT